MAAKSENNSEKETRKSIYTLKLTEEQIQRLRDWLDKHLWSYYAVDHAHFGFKGEKVNVVAYKSGKVVIQGKKMEDFVTYVLEAEITGEARLGYDEVRNPEWYEPHAGLDESGKGDLFGPLVSACVIADGDMVRQWIKDGVTDSKKITSDKAIFTLEQKIRATKGVVIKTTFAGMRKYNDLYHKFGDNLNKLLAWMHAKSLEQALGQKRVSWGMLDQFSKQPLVQRYFEKDKEFELKMMTKAESDPVVAAASIVARAEYVRQMQKLSDIGGMELKKGASAQVKKQAMEIVEKDGPDALGDYAKLHFRTAYQALGLPVPEKTVWKR